MSLIDTVSHRPYPLPQRNWVMSQTWHDLLFAHWPLPAEQLRQLVPPALELDTFDNLAWVGIVPFHMSGIKLRRMPALPYVSRFAELNVRTYVIQNGKPGVFFFCLDAASPVAVEVARRWYNLPYFQARMKVASRGQVIQYSSERTDRRGHPARFEAEYGPDGPVFAAQPGSLEHWLTERYCLYTSDSQDRIKRGDIHHLSWPLQPASASIRLNSMASAHGIELPASPPLLHFSRRLDILAWTPVRSG